MSYILKKRTHKRIFFISVILVVLIFTIILTIHSVSPIPKTEQTDKVIGDDFYTFLIALYGLIGVLALYIVQMWVIRPLVKSLSMLKGFKNKWVINIALSSFVLSLLSYLINQYISLGVILSFLSSLLFYSGINFLVMWVVVQRDTRSSPHPN